MNPGATFRLAILIFCAVNCTRSNGKDTGSGPSSEATNSEGTGPVSSSPLPVAMKIRVTSMAVPTGMDPEKMEISFRLQGKYRATQLAELAARAEGEPFEQLVIACQDPGSTEATLQTEVISMLTEASMGSFEETIKCYRNTSEVKVDVSISPNGTSDVKIQTKATTRESSTLPPASQPTPDPYGTTAEPVTVP